MPYVVTKNHFPEHYVDWADVMTKTAADFEFGATKVLYDEKTLPTLVLHTEFRPGTLNTAFENIKKQIFQSHHNDISNEWLYNINVMHVYYSIGNRAVTFGRHQDCEDVMIVQSYGTIEYLMDDGTPYEKGDVESVKLEPGDSLWIKEGTWHDPIVTEPRITLSLS